MKLKPIADQVVVVFGASSGIGRETALRFAAKGARVVAAARDKEGLDSLVEEIVAAGGQAMAAPAETADYEQVSAVARLAAERYGRIDTWVHLAATSVYARFEDTLPEEFRRVIEVTLLGQIYGALAALPYLKQAGGALIHISSVEAERAIPYHSAYAAAKHGVKGFIDALRLELEHDRIPISVTNIMPASINTPFFETARTRLGVKPRGIPPVYEPEVVADAILHAAEHPTRDLIVGGAGKMIVALQRLSPRLADTVFSLIGFKFQRTDQPKSATAPHSLYMPVAGNNKTRGELGAEARGWSAYTWLQTHPAAKWMTASAVLVAASLLAGRLASKSHE